MLARLQLDLTWRDLGAGLLACATARDRDRLALALETRWSATGDALACLSVRSAFDLYLSVLALPHGSEVLVSAITIPDMIGIVRHHGLVPVPIDLDVESLALPAAALERAVAPATRAILVAHLFGSRQPLDSIIAVARRHRLLVIEDAAQAFMGPQYTGHPEADVSLFSFGTIKTATALGGALVRVRDRAVLAGMRRRQACFPVQRRASYCARLLRSAVLKGLARPLAYGALLGACRLARLDHDRLLHRAVRGFPGQRFPHELRYQPSAPLLHVLARRLRRFDVGRLTLRAALGRKVAGRLAAGVVLPGRGAAVHSHWIFPLVVQDPERTIVVLRDAGFDATSTGSLVAVDPPPDRPQLDPRVARAALARVVYVPLYPEMSTRDVDRLAGLLAALPSGAATLGTGDETAAGLGAVITATAAPVHVRERAVTSR